MIPTAAQSLLMLTCWWNLINQRWNFYLCRSPLAIALLQCLSPGWDPRIIDGSSEVTILHQTQQLHQNNDIEYGSVCSWSVNSLRQKHGRKLSGNQDGAHSLAYSSVWGLKDRVIWDVRWPYLTNEKDSRLFPMVQHFRTTLAEPTGLTF